MFRKIAECLPESCTSSNSRRLRGGETIRNPSGFGICSWAFQRPGAFRRRETPAKLRHRSKCARFSRRLRTAQLLRRNPRRQQSKRRPLQMLPLRRAQSLKFLEQMRASQKFLPGRSKRSCGHLKFVRRTGQWSWGRCRGPSSSPPFSRWPQSLFPPNLATQQLRDLREAKNGNYDGGRLPAGREQDPAYRFRRATSLPANLVISGKCKPWLRRSAECLQASSNFEPLQFCRRLLLLLEWRRTDDRD